MSIHIKTFCPKCGNKNDGEEGLCISCKFNLAFPDKSKPPVTSPPQTILPQNTVAAPAAKDNQNLNPKPPTADTTASASHIAPSTTSCKKGEVSLDSETKKCPFCAELIKSEAIKCRYCGEWLDKISSISGEHGAPAKESKQDVQSVSLTKGALLPRGTSHQQSAVALPSIEKPKEELEGLYKTFLGEKNCIYYLTRFKEFDKQAPGLKASWNWPAFFFGGTWALYRKMYGWFFAFLGILFISIIFEREFPILGFFLLLGPWTAFTIFSNSLYHGSVKKKIAVAQLSISDRPHLIEFLHYIRGCSYMGHLGLYFVASHRYSGRHRHPVIHCP